VFHVSLQRLKLETENSIYSVRYCCPELNQNCNVSTDFCNPSSALNFMISHSAVLELLHADMEKLIGAFVQFFCCEHRTFSLLSSDGRILHPRSCTANRNQWSQEPVLWSGRFIGVLFCSFVNSKICSINKIFGENSDCERLESFCTTREQNTEVSNENVKSP
jgi:hypothetical protein